MRDSDRDEVALDPSEALRLRLQEQYAKQRGQQLASKKKVLEADLSAQSERFNELHPTSIELVSDETTLLMNELEVLCSTNGLPRGVDLVRRIRAAVNRELRESLSYVEDGYSSAFHGLLREVEFRQRQNNTSTSMADITAAAEASMSSPSAVVGLQATLEEERELLQMPGEWKKHIKKEVLQECKYQAAQSSVNTTGRQRTVTLRESLSATTSLFAESLASSLLCEVVRIYLYDENRSLHCCACFPYHAVQGDPMRATFTEIMIAKEVHNAVCGRGIAVNGGEARYNKLSAKDVETVNKELTESGLQSMRSCLIFPIAPSSGSRQTLGMIHAVNKRSFQKGVAATFSADDELTMSVSSRVLGTILSRYPVQYFSLRVGEAFRKAIYPHEDTRALYNHLPSFIADEVDGAAEAGNQALGAAMHSMIFRAPISDVYSTRFQRARMKRLAVLASQDHTLSSVEFNLASINELWEQGMEENVIMHRQYRTLATQESGMRLLLRNVLDGLAATRAMQDAEQMARYLQTLELLGRTENTERLANFVSDTLMESHWDGGAMEEAAERRRQRSEFGSSATPAVVPVLSTTRESYASVRTGGVSLSAVLPADCLGSSITAPSAATATDQAAQASPFLTEAEQEELRLQHTRLNATVVSKMHIDGPEFIRTYSSDPVTKRSQVRFIDEMMRQCQLREEKAKETGHRLAHYEVPTSSVLAKRVQPRKQPIGIPPVVAAAQSKTDFALKRPFHIN